MLVSAVSAVKSYSQRAFNNSKYERLNITVNVADDSHKQQPIKNSKSESYCESCHSYDSINEWKNFCIKQYEQGKLDIIA